MEAFIRVVETGSFTRAGQELRVKQSTVSKWVANLEGQVGQQLLERTSRTQRVTEAGWHFYRRAKEIVETWEAAESELQSDTPAPRGRLRVSLPLAFGRLHVVPHVAHYLARYPDVEVELVFDDRYVNLVEEGFDMAIRVGVPVDSTLRCRTLARTPRRLVAAPAYLERAGTPTTPRDLAHHQCLLHTQLRVGAVWRFERGEERVRARVRGRLGSNNSEAILTMACHGLGIALLASCLVDTHIARGDLVGLLPDWERTDAPIQALLPPGRYVHPRVQTFLDLLAERLRPLSTSATTRT